MPQTKSADELFLKFLKWQEAKEEAKEKKKSDAEKEKKDKEKPKARTFSGFEAFILSCVASLFVGPLGLMAVLSMLSMLKNFLDATLK